MIYKYKRDLLDKLFSETKLLKYSRGEIITQTSDQDSVWFVIKGYVKRYQIGTGGNISVQSIYGPNDVFPLTYVFNILFNRRLYIGPETYFYEAMNPTSLFRLPHTTFKTLVDNNPDIYKDLLAVAGDRLSSNIHYLENISLATSYKRVAHQLLYFAKRWGKPENGLKRIIEIPVTQQDIADILSLTRETVSMSLNELARNKLISKGQRRYVIHNISRLEKEAFA